MSALLTKSINKVIGNIVNFGKDSKSFLSDLKAGIILLESSKNPINSKLETLEVENKNLHKTIAELKKEIEQLKKEENNEKGGD